MYKQTSVLNLHPPTSFALKSFSQKDRRSQGNLLGLLGKIKPMVYRKKVQMEHRVHRSLPDKCPLLKRYGNITSGTRKFPMDNRYLQENEQCENVFSNKQIIVFVTNNGMACPCGPGTLVQCRN